MLYMVRKNRYIKNAKISEVKTREGVKYFAADLLATQAAQLSGLNRNTINRIYAGLHEKIYAECEIQRPMFGIVEVDESVFGAKRVKGKRGRGAYGKTVVFGIKERLGKVYTEIVPDCSKATLQSIIRGKVAPESVINSDGWRGYNGLVDLGSRGLGLRSLQSASRSRSICLKQQPYQRHRGVLGCRKGAFRTLPRHASRYLYFTPQRDRVALQQPLFRYLQTHVKNPST